MEEELKKVNDFKKIYRSVHLKIYRNTSNGVKTQTLTVFIAALKTTYSWIFYINSTMYFDLNCYIFSSPVGRLCYYTPGVVRRTLCVICVHCPP